MKRITIIGGGASGTLLAVNLIKHNGDTPIEINLVERRKTIGRGVAYSTAEDIPPSERAGGEDGSLP
jgi:uncharacterized NAD(P)/FAD-binding protein YdhS